MNKWSNERITRKDEQINQSIHKYYSPGANRLIILLILVGPAPGTTKIYLNHISLLFLQSHTTCTAGNPPVEEPPCDELVGAGDSLLSVFSLSETNNETILMCLQHEGFLIWYLY